MFDPKQLGDMLNQFQEKLKEMNNAGGETTFTTRSGGGLVEVSFNAGGEVIDIKIDDSLLEDKDSLQILLMGAINDGYKSVETHRQNSALNMLGNLNLFNK